MLRITADVFSGRPNPCWILNDENEVRATLKELTQQRSLIAEAAPATGGLGLRGFLVESLSDELGRDFGFSDSLYLPAGVGSSGTDSKAQELAERLIRLSASAEASVDAGDVDAIPLDEALQTFLLDQLQPDGGGRTSVADNNGADAAAADTGEIMPAATCMIELSPYNPGFWNNNQTILRNNNCYNYASNKRTDTFAQPGRGCGRIYSAITCLEMSRASLCDGLHRRFDCFPAAEAPRYLVALVVAPGPGFKDFHWYRKMKEGYWGHKPGGTAVRNVDNSNRLILDPATCNRGPYTQFCGYFYTCRSQRIR